MFAVLFLLITGGRAPSASAALTGILLPWRGLSLAVAFLLLVLALHVYLGRFDAPV